MTFYLSKLKAQLLRLLIVHSWHIPCLEKIFIGTLCLGLMTRQAYLLAASKDYRNLIQLGKHKPLTLLTIHSDFEDYKLENHFSDVADFCDDFEITGINDQVLLSTGGIQVSWVSTHKQESGKSVMLHELAHLAYKSLSDPLNADISLDSRVRFGETLQCLADNHPGGDTLPAINYVEEDWSDLIASKGNPINEANVGCFVSDQNDNKYIGLGLTNEGSFYKPLEEDHQQITSFCLCAIILQASSDPFMPTRSPTNHFLLPVCNT